MACNYPTDSDNMSEYSETGISGWDSNWDSKEDLADLMAKLGIQDTIDLYRVRFVIDRKKLEQMLTGGDDMIMPADVFFAKVMEDTNTQIFWPNRLKIGAKSKKDPHIRVVGRLNDVQMAKNRIMNLLDPRSSRVTMKMDVSYTDHSHIIGRGGLSIKRVMDESQSHVHFPDSNRVNPNEKSNQVSISGDIKGVEKARSRVRDLIPLIFGFEPPIMSKNIDYTSSYIMKVQEQFNVQVMFKTRPKLHATYVMVKGVEWEADQVKKATLLLVDYMCESLANQTSIQMSMEISPQHHSIVLGKDHSNLKTIAKATNCKIMFPDALDPNIPSLKKSKVNISGNFIDDVYRARQLLMGSLPLLIIFDLPEDAVMVRTKVSQIAEIQAACEVTISIRQKSKQNLKACIVKGVEKHTGNIYKARSLILGLDDPPILADIPASYHLSSNSPTNNLIPTPTNLNPSNVSYALSPGILSPLLTTGYWQYPTTAKPSPVPSFTNGLPSPIFGLLPAGQPHFSYNVSQPSLGSSGYHSANQSQHVLNSLVALEQNNNSSLSTISSNSSFVGQNSNYRLFPDSPIENRDVSPTLPDFPRTSLSHTEPKYNNGFDSEMGSRRLAGLKAMQNGSSRSSGNSYRVPTNFWSGYGISHTSPGNFASRNEVKTDNDIWNMPTSPNVESRANNSNLVDHIPTHIVDRLITSEWKNMSDLLTSLGLERYVTLFVRHRIDLSRFASMNEGDLVWIGVNATDARKRMLLAICELNKRARPFLSAPGAERGSPTKYNHWLN